MAADERRSSVKRPAPSSGASSSSSRELLHVSPTQPSGEPRPAKRLRAGQEEGGRRAQQAQSQGKKRRKLRRGQQESTNEKKKKKEKGKGKGKATKARPSSLPPATVFPHGNYDSFFWYARQVDVWADCRLKAIHPSVLRQPHLFQRRDCLDVGCNSGVLDIGIVAAYAPRKLVGVDIDATVVRRARSLLQRKEREDASFQRGVLSFEQLDFLSLPDAPALAPSEQYDTVLCMCVTKWVFATGGEDALRRLFRLIAQRTRPGGFLILQPQPKASAYERLRARHLEREGGHAQDAEPRLTLDAERGFASALNAVGFSCLCKSRPVSKPERGGGAAHKIFLFKKRSR